LAYVYSGFSIWEAFVIAGLEALCIISNKLELSGGLWSFINNINDNFGNMGYVIIG